MYGKSHVIRGLVDLHGAYTALDEQLFSFADYVLFLGYSGLVLSSAVEQLTPAVRAGKSGRLFAWGFHDGDIFPMTRAIGTKIERLKS